MSWLGPLNIWNDAWSQNELAEMQKSGIFRVVGPHLDLLDSVFDPLDGVSVDVVP